MPFHLLFILLSFIPLLGRIFDGPVAKRKTWGIGQTLFLAFFQRFIWTFFYGLPAFNATPFQLNGVPFTAKVFNCSGIFRSLSRSIFGARKTGDDVLNVSEVLIDAAPGPWLAGAPTDPHSIVLPGKVSCYWLRPQDQEESVRDKVIMYLVQGGFIRSNGLEAPFAWNMSRETGTPLFSVEYRKAIDRSRCFPASIQDALAGYNHLISIGFSPKNICVVGDSAGGGLVHSLMLQTALLHNEGVRDSTGGVVQMPGRCMMLSPWVDLTMSSGDQSKHRYDIIYPPMERQGAWSYLADRRAKYYKNREADRMAEAAGRPSVDPVHPMLSPALKNQQNEAAHDVMVKSAVGCGGVRMLITWGGAEVSMPEAVSLSENVQAAVDRYKLKDGSLSIEVSAVEGEDGIHCYGSFYDIKSPEGIRFYDLLRDLLRDKITSP